MIWLHTSYPACNACLDATFVGCGRDYNSVAYATCMCKGPGGPNTVTCVGVCDAADALGANLGSVVAGGWYSYCVDYFKEMCPDAEQFMTAERFREKCGPDSGPGIADAVVSGAVSSSESSSGTSTGGALATESASVGTTTRSRTDATATLRAESTGTSTSSGSTAVAATSTPSNDAMRSNSISRWGVIVGLGILIARMNM
ncbi:hypothetical protein GLAREA_04061 [Glarea lozoyensis ATCC 20868]|uniref:Uncharacterized protein n=1 Tax=Glarea lozoyensis (strain ATCC 20868 / MF5171) TaxID=1116229 RepID=S3D1P9_GLAL2|nr:uncharacterized protein GLAREA_04061 [Glarea lozoyensis ATCC 20868]EPE31094.1 hypothetical protein GLAREA_04061 [Glarea lozoyensis ATCC 20868]